MTEKADYAGVLSELRRERDELDGLIAALERRMGATGAPSPTGRTAELTENTFFGMKTLDAAKKYLEMETRPQTAPDIAAAPQRGGLQKEAKNFTNAVYTMLYREDSRGGTVIRLPQKKWGLAERFPDATRKRNAELQAGKVASVASVVIPAAPVVETIEPEQPDELSQSAEQE